MKRGILALGAICAVLAFFPASSHAVAFDTPARLGDRSVGLTWAPDTDDPLYTGNLRLFPLGSLQSGTREIRHILFDRFGDKLWVMDGNASEIVGFDNTASRWVVDTTLAPLGLGAVASAALHPAGHLLIAGLDDGRLAIWRLHQSGPPLVMAAHLAGACRGVAFGSQASERDSSFFTAGDDGHLIRWLRPGIASRDSLIDPSGITALGISSASDICALGISNGKVALWSVTGQFNHLLDIAAHPGRRVEELVFSAASDRVASTDTQGGVRLWDARFGVPLGPGYDPPTPDPVHIAFTPRKSELIPYAHASGLLGALDGTTGLPFAVRTDLPQLVTAFAFSPDGRTSFLGGPDGQLNWWFQGACIPSVETPECFGGYIVMRGVSLDPSELVFLRQYQYGDTTWPWTARDSLRCFVDPDSVIPRGGGEEREAAGPHNGVPFFYTLIKYYRRYVDGLVYTVFQNTREQGSYREIPGGDPVPLIPRNDAVRTTPLLDQVYVVPSPYIENDPLSRFGEFSPPMVRFERLPARATIRIFTMNGDLVRTLDHVETTETGGSCPWDLRNEDRREVASGVYIYAIDTPSGEQRTGFLTLVR